MADMVKNKDLEAFVNDMKKAAAHFGDTESALRRSEKLIGTKIAEHDELVHSIGRERALKHIYSGVVHYGNVKKVGPRSVILERGGKTTELLIENVRLLDEQELIAWKTTSLRTVTRDVSVFIPRGSDPEILKNVLNSVGGVVSSDIIDVFKKQNDTSVTYRIAIFADSNAALVQGSVETLLRGIGCTVR
jgi:prephenate dehydrogenase